MPMPQRSSVGDFFAQLNDVQPPHIEALRELSRDADVQTEARHVAAIALLTGDPITPSGAFDKPLSKSQVLAKAGPLIKP